MGKLWPKSSEKKLIKFLGKYDSDHITRKIWFRFRGCSEKPWLTSQDCSDPNMSMVTRFSEEPGWGSSENLWSSYGHWDPTGSTFWGGNIRFLTSKNIAKHGVAVPHLFFPIAVPLTYPRGMIFIIHQLLFRSRPRLKWKGESNQTHSAWQLGIDQPAKVVLFGTAPFLARIARRASPLQRLDSPCSFGGWRKYEKVITNTTDP